MAQGIRQVGGRMGKAQGFTLIELLVVITIIVILIAILVPVLGAAKNKARVVDTTNEMMGLQTAATRYMTDFGTAPGPIGEGSTGISTGTRFTGNQNLLISLARQFYWTSPQALPATTATTAITTDGGVTFCADPNSNSTPLDYAKLNPVTNNAGRPYDSYWVPRPGEVFLYPSNYFSPVAPWTVYPVIVDHFLDPLPILYYRAISGTDALLDQTAPAFNATANGAFLSTTTPIKSTTGIVYSQAASAYRNISSAGGSQPSLNTVLYASVGGTLAPTGGFVLISAGLDRTYGKFSSTVSDDIVVSGGGH